MCFLQTGRDQADEVNEDVRHLEIFDAEKFLHGLRLNWKTVAGQLEKLRPR